MKLAPASPGVAAESALAFAMAGDSARTEALVQDLKKRFPLDSQMQSIWLPSIQAQLALARKNPALAITTLQAPSSMELGQFGFAINFSCLDSVYVRGEAYLAVGQGPAAAAEFQKILDHSGIVWNCWTGALLIWAWLGQMPCRQKLRNDRVRRPMRRACGHSPPTRTSLLFGKTPIPRSRS